MQYPELKKILNAAERWAWENQARLSPRGQLIHISTAIIGKQLTLEQLERIQEKLKKFYE